MKEALKTLEEMPEEEFQAFFKLLPGRTTMMLEARFVDWREVLPEWYIKFKTEGLVG